MYPLVKSPFAPSELEQRVVELSVVIRHGANNPIMLDEEDEIRAGSPMPLMIRIKWEDTLVPPSCSPSPL
jgi:hypothetical protein